MNRMASILWMPTIFLVASCTLYLLSINSPPLSEPNVPYNVSTSSDYKEIELRFPRSFNDLSDIASLLRRYRHNHIEYLLLLFCSAYLYKQAFAIPGSFFMNMLAGATFGLWYGFPLICLLTATGATLCFLLSQGFGKYYVLKYIPNKVVFLRRKVAESTDSLFFFLLFMRLFPMSPNWLLNIVSPILDIPIHLFFASVLVGLVPYNFICVETGAMLADISDARDIFTAYTLLKLASIAFVALVPGLLMKKLQPGQSRLKTS